MLSVRKLSLGAYFSVVATNANTLNQLKNSHIYLLNIVLFYFKSVFLTQKLVMQISYLCFTSTDKLH